MSRDITTTTRTNTPSEHEHGRIRIPIAPRPGGRPLRARNVIALGLAGGMVPSASALIVLLVAVSTGRLLLGMTLIVAFGIGMAVVLGGLAVATTWLRGAVLRGGGRRVITARSGASRAGCRSPRGPR